MELHSATSSHTQFVDVILLQALREGSNHSIYTDGERTIPLKRHKQFDRITANELCKQAGLGKQF